MIIEFKEFMFMRLLFMLAIHWLASGSGKELKSGIAWNELFWVFWFWCTVLFWLRLNCDCDCKLFSWLFWFVPDGVVGGDVTKMLLFWSVSLLLWKRLFLICVGGGSGNDCGCWGMYNFCWLFTKLLAFKLLYKSKEMFFVKNGENWLKRF